MGFLKEMPKYRTQIFASLLIFVGFFLYAFRFCIIGTSLLDLEIRVQQDFATTSRLITSHSAGYFIGAIVVTLLDRYFEDFVTMGVGTSMAGATLVIIPMLYNFYLMIFASFLNGVGNAMYDLKCHYALTNLWGPKRVGNSIQFLHMFFGIGALFLPTYVRIFLLPIPDELIDDYEAVKNLYKPEDVQIMWPYVTLGVPSVVIGFLFFYYYFNNPYPAEVEQDFEAIKSRKSVESRDPKDVLRRPSQHSRWKIYLAVFWVATMAFLGFALVSMICSYVQAFGVKSSLHMDKKTAALVAAVFWVSFTSARALFVVLTMFISEYLVCGVCIFMMLGSTIILFGFITISPICLWVTAVGLGAGYSPLFPVAYSLLAKYFPLTGQQSSMIFLSGIIGDSLNTAVSGSLIDLDPMLFAYHIGLLALLYALFSLALPFLCWKMFGKMVEIDDGIELKERSRIGSFMMPPPTRSDSSTLSIN